MQEVWIMGAARTAIGKFGGALKYTPIQKLGAAVITAALERAQIEANQVDEVIMGCVLTAGQRQNPARLASMEAGISIETCAWSINMVCGSGLKAIGDGMRDIMAGEADIVIAGGMENMSSAPFLLPQYRWGHTLGNHNIIDSIINDGLHCGIANIHMGITAENIAKKYQISREEQDIYAYESQLRASVADFSQEVVPIAVKQSKLDTIFSADEFIRPDTTVKGLSNLKPAFMENGSVTAGNSSGINDGAAAVVLCSAKKGRELGLKPMARLVAVSQNGVDPKEMGMGPVPATRAVLKKAAWSISDLDLIEINEAFAAQSIAVMRELGLASSITNVHGGAIALGHPIGCSGARILVTLLYAMKERNARRGLASLCIGGGMGVSALVENL